MLFARAQRAHILAPIPTPPSRPKGGTLVTCAPLVSTTGCRTHGIVTSTVELTKNRLDKVTVAQAEPPTSSQKLESSRFPAKPSGDARKTPRFASAHGANEKKR